MLDILDKDIGGARVRRAFTGYKAGDHMTTDQVLAIRLPNRRALIDSNFIEVYPKAMGMEGEERFIIRVANNQFNVVEGRVLNDTPIDEKSAKELARS